MSRLTHRDGGKARMVDVGGKPVTRREAVALSELRAGTAALDALRSGSVSKGDAWAVARVAGIMAAKRAHELIPLCHPIALESVGVEFFLKPDRVLIRARAAAWGKTGVEMEAMTAAAVAGLALYDMLKSVDRGMALGPVVLARKSGGSSGTYERPGFQAEGGEGWR